MLKILIVDDEYFVRMGIKSMVQQKESNYTILADAENGIMAVDFIQKEKPDIVFLDITMPGMNGIEVLEKVRGTGFEGYIAMLTCHEDFRLVQQAIRLGADDYVLKNELTGEAFIDYLEKVGEKIEKNNASNKNEDLSKLQKQQEEDFYKENFLKNILQIGGMDKNVFARGKRRYHVNIHNEGIYIISVYMKQWEKIVERYKDSDLRLLYGTIDNMLSEVFKDYEEWDGFYSEPYCYQILFTCSKERSQLTIEEKIRSIVNNLAYHFEHILDIDIVIAVYRNIYSLEAIPQGYRESEKLLEQRFFQKDKKIFWNGIQNIYELADMDCLKEILESDTDGEFKEKIETFLVGQKDKLIDKKVFFEILKRKFLPYAEQLGMGFLTNIDNYECIEDLLKEIEQMDLKIVEYKEGENYSFLVRQAIQLIQKEFRGKITLEKVAEQLGISAGYFSRIFSAETHETFSNYVINKRIEYAKELIGTTNYKFYEIAEICGFNSPVHFNNTFKKICGVTPNQYRNDILKIV